MKRLILPLLAALALPTAVNANPFSGDIVLKNDIGEKYIVKKTAVNIRVEDRMYSIENSLSGQLYRDVAELYKEKNDIRTAKIFEEGAIDRENNFYKFKYLFEKYNEDKIVTYKITYKPIFQDLNNFKKVLEEKEILCLNPVFKNESFPDLLYSEQLVLTDLDNKVCNKYAKF